MAAIQGVRDFLEVLEKNGQLLRIAEEVALDAMRIHGGYGYSQEYPIERIYRDAPLLIIGETAIASKKQLTDDFASIPVGALVRVTFKGKVNLAGGKTFNRTPMIPVRRVDPRTDHVPGGQVIHSAAVGPEQIAFVE